MLTNLLFAESITYLSGYEQVMDMRNRNKIKMDSLWKEYDSTKDLPRKAKKRRRKYLKQELIFWYNIGLWDKEMLNLNN